MNRWSISLRMTRTVLKHDYFEFTEMQQSLVPPMPFSIHLCQWIINSWFHPI